MICHDAAQHNYIANHPAVKPTLGYNAGYTDFTPLLADPDNYVLLADGDVAAVFECSAPRVWQAHTMPEPRLPQHPKPAPCGIRALCSRRSDSNRVP